MIKSLFVFLVVFLPCEVTPITLLHEFNGASGGKPNGDLLLVNNTFFGMTFAGGIAAKGTIFSIDKDGDNYTVLHYFSGGENDGSHPWGSLIISDNILYGMTRYGGIKDCGVVFSINIDGSSFNILHRFAGENPGEGIPDGNLVLFENTLYGMNKAGGNIPGVHEGEIFSISTNGENYSVLHTFQGGENDGAEPSGDLIVYGNKLYGMTHEGGNSNLHGIIFSIEMDGNNFSILHKFSGGSGDGSRPFGSLIVSEDKFYGMTEEGGANNMGVIFEIDTDGSNFSVLHEFSGSDGKWPKGNVIMRAGKLWGMTEKGGSSDNGVIFSMDKNGDNFSVLHNFNGGTNDGSEPWGSLTISGLFLYGMTNGGGDTNVGVVFSLEDQSLPVTLSSFTARQYESDVLLEWITESELDNLGFILERRAENSEWIRVADYTSHPQLIGQNTATNRTKYTFMDDSIKEGFCYEYRLSGVDVNGRIECLEITRITIKKLESEETPKKLVLYQAFPNPFNSATTVTFDISEKSNVKLTIIDILGSEIEILANSMFETGHHQIVFNDPGLPSGVYLYRIETADLVETKKMLLLR
jgi:uncharacterized repeat protein (TIGR03803 family)